MNNFWSGNFREPPPDAPGLFSLPEINEEKSKKNEELKEQKTLLPKISLSMRKISIKPETLGE